MSRESAYLSRREGSFAVNHPRGVRTWISVIVPSEFYYLSDVKESKAIQISMMKAISA